MGSSREIRISTPASAAGRPGVAVRSEGWSGLFWSAFRQARNPMALVDAERFIVEVNGNLIGLLGYRREQLLRRPIWDLVIGGPLLSPAEWKAAPVAGGLTGQAALMHSDGTHVAVQWAG